MYIVTNKSQKMFFISIFILGRSGVNINFMIMNRTCYLLYYCQTRLIVDCATCRVPSHCGILLLFLMLIHTLFCRPDHSGSCLHLADVTVMEVKQKVHL